MLPPTRRRPKGLLASGTDTRRVFIARMMVLVALAALTASSSLAVAQVPLPEMGPIRSSTGPLLYFSSGGRMLDLTIDSATPGSEPLEVTDSTTEIAWDASYVVPSKMTVSTICPGQSFSLFVELEVTSWASGTVATEQPEIELVDSMMDTDILRDIPITVPGRMGSGVLTYRASATVAQGSSSEHGDDFHMVTLTIVAQ